MSNRLFQTVIHQMKDVVGRTIGVIDENGIVVACSELGKIGESRQRIREELLYSSSSVSTVIEGCTYRFLSSSGAKLESIVFVAGDDAEASKMAQMLSISLGSTKVLYDEKYDKCSFVKNIILDNILPSDIYVKSNELHFSNDECRVVLNVKFQNDGVGVPYEIVLDYVTDRNKDYVISISEQDVVIVKEVEKGTDSSSVNKFAQDFAKKIEKDHGRHVLIGISSIVENLKDLAMAYKESRIAIEVGKVFDIERTTMCYESLGIGRLIYQLPTTLCEIFLSEVFNKGSLESLDRETLMTVQCFFENNLNVSETSRKLFVHRNTLVYRLEKIRKITGLDLREFEHAVTFKVALMVKKYLTSKPTKF